MTDWNTENGAKPRFDGKGTEFGLMHRDLGRGFNMFDIDRLYAFMHVQAVISGENSGFVEYRLRGQLVEFPAMFELKHDRTHHSEMALSVDDPNAIARAEMARRIGARLFVVFQTAGKQPMDFYEIDTASREPTFKGTLDYTSDTKAEAVKTFWRDVLNIYRVTPSVSK